MSAATEDVLTKPETGEPVVWRNPDSGNSGTVAAGDVYVRPAGATSQDQQFCRDVEQTVELADGTTETVTTTACRSETGEWELVS